MKRLWRPWRIGYVRDIESIREQGCIFCTKPAYGDDRASLILHRSETAFIIMNLYPYNNGHVMVSPFRHVAGLEELEKSETRDLMDLSILAVRALEKAMQPQGFNLGMNLGKVAGAGYDEHLHIHIVPRWQGDSNFMPVIAGTKVMPESLEENYERLRSSIVSLLDED